VNIATILQLWLDGVFLPPPAKLMECQTDSGSIEQWLLLVSWFNLLFGMEIGAKKLLFLKSASKVICNECSNDNQRQVVMDDLFEG